MKDNKFNSNFANILFYSVPQPKASIAQIVVEKVLH